MQIRREAIAKTATGRSRRMEKASQGSSEEDDVNGVVRAKGGVAGRVRQYRAMAAEAAAAICAG